MPVSGKVVYGSDGSARYFVGADEVTKEVFDERFPTKPLGVPMLGNNTPACWPMVSEALAVHPDQAREANERNARHGVAARYDGEGMCHIPDRSDRAKLLKLEGFHDNHGGYGD